MKLPALPRLAALLFGIPCLAFAGDDPSLAIRHDVFVTTDLAPDACERAQDRLITVEEDTTVQYCFRVQNLGDVTLTTHDLVTDAFGKLDSMRTLTLAPGQVFNRSHLALATDDLTTTGTWIARDVAPAYTPSPTTYDFTDIETTGTEIVVYTWEAQTITVPFPVRLYGRTSQYLSVCNLGMIQVDSFRGLCGMLPEPIPSGWELAVMPFWARLDWFMGGVYTKTLGQYPHRRQIVQWRRAMELGGAPDGNGVTFQAVFTEEDDRIVFVYPDVTFGLPNGDAGQAAVIGVNYDANLGQMYSYFSPVLTNGQAILWTPNVWHTTQSSNSATVLVHSARVAVAPNAIATRQAPDSVVERRVTIANTGRMPLDWHFGEAQTASTAHIPKHPRPVVANREHERLDVPPEWRRARPAVPPLLAPQPHGPKLPTGYGRDNGGEEFVKVDLSTGLVEGISRVQDSPVGTVDFRDGDYSTLYSLIGWNPAALITVATDDGQRADVGQSNAPGREGWFGMTFDSTTGTLYGATSQFYLDYDGNFYCGPNAYLYRINPDVGTPRLIGQVGNDLCLLDIATNANGEMFGIDTQSDALIAIDKTTGAGTVVGPLGVPITPYAGLDFDEAANVLYLAVWNSASMQSELRTVDTTTGASTFAAQFHRADGSFTYMISLGLESGGRGCTAPADVPWLTLVAPAAGTLAPDGETGVTVRVDATNLGEGHYEALLCLFSNDPRNRFVTLPVSLDVDADAIFGDGFE
ncbi:MAG TPA: DUF4394 domain-containing protein [Tahibacter sp.]|nr:DUF4394 domain-containing protein [Tahibacter sp.]